MVQPCYLSYGSGQAYDDTYPSLWYQAEYFQCLKNPLYSIYVSLPQPLATAELFNCLYSFVFFRVSYSWTHRVMEPFQDGFFHSVICIQDSSMSFHGLIAHILLVLNNILLLSDVPQFTPFTY